MDNNDLKRLEEWIDDIEIAQIFNERKDLKSEPMSDLMERFGITTDDML
jgi:hypothetical protein